MRRKPFERNMMGVRPLEEETGREAITMITPLSQYDWRRTTVTLLSCQIKTGRTHQIRVHAKYIGHPVIGDQLYTNKTATLAAKQLGAARQLLHAHQLTFTHPVTKELLSLSAPIPADFQGVLTKLTPPDSL
jgi:23S rRNA-/tRNA-specific pseudouridylate synthase